jgi:predicted ATPase
MTQSEKKGGDKIHITIPEEKEININFSNFGPISDGKFQIRKLTLIHGPNGAGKSYSATMAYSLLKLFNNPIKQFKISSHDIDEISKWVKHLPIDKEMNISDEIHTYLTRQVFSQIIRDPTDYFFEYFGCKPHKLVNYKNKQFQISTNIRGIEIIFTLNKINNPDEIDWEIIIEKPTLNFRKIPRTTPKEKGLLGYVGTPINISKNQISFDEDVQINDLCETLYSHYLLIFNKNIQKDEIYFLPASRTGIIQMHKDVIENKLRSSHNKTDGVSTSQINRDFLYTFYEGSPPINANSNSLKIKKVLKRIEEKIIQGQIIRNEMKFGRIEYLLRINELEHNIFQSSSLVTEIAPLIIYLRYFLKSGDILFIEEPESHLNLRNQWLLAKLIVGCVRAGLKFVIITHSHYLLSRINNFILASRLSATDKNQLDIFKEYYLNPNEVIINEFVSNDEEKHNFQIKNILITEKGIPFDSINSVVDEISEEYHLIMDCLENQSK